MKTLTLFALLCGSFTLVNAQRFPAVEPLTQPSVMPSSNAGQQGVPYLHVVKRPGHFSANDWRAVTDSLWGPGIPTAEKLSIFDTFWYLVDQQWGGFPNLRVNWDSLREVYRPQVAAGVSRGRFYGILSRLSRALNEWHVYVQDPGIDESVGFYLRRNSQFPNYQSYQYRPGIPIIDIDAQFWRTHFGAGLTPLPDSTAMVYSVMPSHPLNLQPGDIVLGYDGIPWKDLLVRLLDWELPILGGGGFLGSSPASSYHVALMSVGNNWGLFDTIDVIRYSTKDTAHYPTSLLGNITPPYFIATEQMGVRGVPFPDIQSNKLVSWGVVEGTDIGYIYAWDWNGVPTGNTGTLFSQAVDDLIHNRDVQGLILDFRTNGGGMPENANEGFKQLFNADPTAHYGVALRAAGGDHFSFTLTPPRAQEFFVPTPELFDHPIAVLTGPNCGSAGDYNTFRLRFHPMARSFGKQTNGAYTAAWIGQNGLLPGSSYYCRVDKGAIYSNYNNEGVMIHKSFPVDEEVWLTRDGVSKGEDDVVKRALEWINSLSYAHDVSLDRKYVRPGLDSVLVTATLTNPLHHAVGLSTIVTDANGSARDSVVLHNDGLHGDGLPGDSIWGTLLRAPSAESFYSINVVTTDNTIGSVRRLPAATSFTTSGPIVCVGDTSDKIPAWGQIVRFKFRLQNLGNTAELSDLAVRVRSLDTAAYCANTELRYASIRPGETSYGSSIQMVGFSKWLSESRDVPFEMQISTGGVEFWRDTIQIRVLITDIAENIPPMTCSLDQNYPNPFNPSTTIRYGLPNRSHVTLTVFNTLGQQVALLQNGEQEAGYHEVHFDSGGLASGVYLYRLQAGTYTSTRKFVLVK